MSPENLHVINGSDHPEIKLSWPIEIVLTLSQLHPALDNQHNTEGSHQKVD